MAIQNPGRKRTPPRLLLSSLAVLFLVSNMAATPARSEIVFANGSDYLPFADPNLPKGGLTTDIVTQAMALLGEDFRWERMKWAVGLAKTRTGEVRGAFSWIYSEDRDDDFVFSDSVYDLVNRLFLLDTADVIPEEFEDIEGMTICRPEGYGVPDRFREAFDSGFATLQEALDMKRCFEFLRLERVDAVMAPTLQGWANIDNDPDLNEFNVVMAPWDVEINIHSVVMAHNGRDNCRLAARLNGAMAIMRRDGRYNSIVTSHLGAVADLAPSDEVYRVELEDGTVIRGYPIEYQRGVFLVETLDGETALAPDDQLVVLRREGVPIFDRDDRECRDAKVVVAPVPDPDAPPPAVKPQLTFVGARAVAERIMPALIEAYARQDDIEREITVSDRDEGGKLFAIRGFGKDRAGSFAVVPGDTAQGFAALSANASQLALADRPAAPGEIAPRDASADLGAQTGARVLGLEAFAVVVHPDNPIRYLASRAVEMDTLADIAAGRITDWASLGVNHGTITPIAAEGVGDLLGVPALREAEPQSVVTAVAINPQAIGFLPLAIAEAQDELVVVPVAACGAQRAVHPFSVKTEEYPLARRLMAYLPPSNDNRHAAGFVAFAESGQGQAAIEAAGAVGLTIGIQDPDVRAAALADIVRQEAAAEMAAEVRAYREMAIKSQRVSTTFRFRGGSDALDERALEDARRLARYLRDRAGDGGIKVTLVGFADSRGLAPSNLDLAMRRAESVVAQLAAEGFSGARAMAVGEDVSVACNTTDAGRLLNRRVEVWLE